MQIKKSSKRSIAINTCLFTFLFPVFISPQSLAIPEGSLFNIETHDKPRLLVTRELNSNDVTVDALAAIGNSDGKLIGGTSESIKIRIERGRGTSVGIAFFESELDTIRTGMKSSAWLAVTFSSLLLGDSLGEYNLSFDAKGSNLDGPSAGGLFTVAVLSLLRGDKIRSDMTMTGTINPDGSIGIVGGIAYKLEGARRIGKKLVLIPRGTKNAEVVASESKQGVKVQEVANIYEAYRILTGKPLKREVLPDSELSLLTSEVVKIGTATERYHRRYEELFKAQIIQLPTTPEFKQAVEGSLRNSNVALERSKNHLREGAVSGGYVKALEARNYLSDAIKTASILRSVEQKDYQSVLKDLELSSRDGDEKIGETLRRLSRLKPKSVSDSIAIVKAYRELALGLATKIQLDEYRQLIQLSSTPEEKLFYSGAAANQAAFMELPLQNAFELLSIDFNSGSNTNPPPDLKILKSFSHNYFQAASANLSYFDSLVKDPKRRNLDANYISARRLQQVALIAERENVTEEIRAYLKLAAAISCYNTTNLLVAKYYSLGAKVDENGVITGYRNEIALDEMLKFADQRARELIVLSRNSGNSVVLQLLEYEGARLLQRNTPEDQLTALWRFWNASS